MSSPAPERQGLAFRRLALLSAALLSCTTIRTPVSTIAPEVAVRQGRPEPQIELWVESNQPLKPEEAERYRGEARAAIETALEGRSQAEGNELVVIRAQGVTRTSGHRHDQTAATAGIIVGAIVIVAVAVVAIIAGANSHGSGGSHSAPKATPSGGRGAPSVARATPPARSPSFAAPRVHGAPAPAVPVARTFPSVPPPRIPGPRITPAVPPARSFPPRPPPPAWSAPHATADVEVGFWWTIPIYEPEPVYVYDLPPAPPPPPPPPDEALAGTPVEGAAGDEFPDEAPADVPPEIDLLTMSPPEQLPVGDRGFFAGDRLVLEATVLDRTTGEALRVKKISRKVDPRNAGEVKKAVDALLSDGGWEPPAS